MLIISFISAHTMEAFLIVFVYQCRFREDEEIKYIEPSTELQKMERNSLEISFEDVEQFDQALATTIIEDYYRYIFLPISRTLRSC